MIGRIVTWQRETGRGRLKGPDGHEYLVLAQDVAQELRQAPCGAVVVFTPAPRRTSFWRARGGARLTRALDVRPATWRERIVALIRGGRVAAAPVQTGAHHGTERHPSVKMKRRRRRAA